MSLTFSSCGNEDNPLISTLSEEEITTALAGIEVGETITINFTYGGNPFYATFKKTGESTYEFLADESSLPEDEVFGGFEMGTRTAAETISYSADVKIVDGKIVFSFYQRISSSDTPRLVMQAIFNPVDDTYEVTTSPGFTAVFENIKIGDAVPSSVKDATKTITVTEGSNVFKYSYIEGETWAELIGRYKELFEGNHEGPGSYVIDQETGEINTNMNNFILYYNDGETRVLSTDIVGKDGDESYKLYGVQS